MDDCDNLTRVTIPDGVTYIGADAFGGCNSLTSIGIPKSVTSIGEFSFADCYNMSSIIVEPDNTNYASIDGVLFNKSKTKLIKYPNGKLDSTYTIPNSVSCLGQGAFLRCNHFTSVIIPNSVTSIEMGTFNGCEGFMHCDIRMLLGYLKSGWTLRLSLNCLGTVRLKLPTKFISM